MKNKFEGFEKAIHSLEEGEYHIYFFCPDFEKPSGGVGLLYDQVKILNDLGFNAIVLHDKEGFIPEWLEDRKENIPIKYLSTGDLNLKVEDFIFVPEGMPNIVENLRKQNVSSKIIFFCQNWYYVLNALSPGMTWINLGVKDCLSVSRSQSEYLRMIMPYLRIKEVVGSINFDRFYVTKQEFKKPVIGFLPSRDGGLKSTNVIKTFYAMFPQFRWIQFRQLSGLGNDEFAEAMRECAFYCHFDEASSWGTAPIEAFRSGCLVGGWDGVGGIEYMRPVRDDNEIGNMWLVPNGDILKLTFALGGMIEAWIADEVPEFVWKNMEIASSNYTAEAERDSVQRAHNEYRDERVKELIEILEKAKEIANE
ncbi:MAG: hypothetical protein ACFFG0_18935 [Candidatus Thorarchaeota archaeon]